MPIQAVSSATRAANCNRQHGSRASGQAEHSSVKEGQHVPALPLAFVLCIFLFQAFGRCDTLTARLYPGISGLISLLRRQGTSSSLGAPTVCAAT